MAKEEAQIIQLRQVDQPQSKKWIGRIAIFEMITGSRIQGKIIAISPDWIDTDNGAIRVEHIVHAKWVGEEEAQIIRGGPIGPYNPYLFKR